MTERAPGQVLPGGIEPGDEISIEWNQGEGGDTKVVASLGGAKITIDTDDESSHLVPWLVASAPQILEAAWAAIEQEDTQEEA